MKIKCEWCDGYGETLEQQGFPDPAQWVEVCEYCKGTGTHEVSLWGHIWDIIQTIIFKIKCLPYRLTHKQPIESDDIPF